MFFSQYIIKSIHHCFYKTSLWLRFIFMDCKMIHLLFILALIWGNCLFGRFMYCRKWIKVRLEMWFFFIKRHTSLIVRESNKLISLSFSLRLSLTLSLSNSLTFSLATVSCECDCCCCGVKVIIIFLMKLLGNLYNIKIYMYDTNTSAAVYGLQSVKHPNQISEYQWGDFL